LQVWTGNGQNGGGPDFFNVGINGNPVFSNTFANFGGGNTQSYPDANIAPVARNGVPTTNNAPGTGAAGTNALGWGDICGCGPEFNVSICDISGLTGTAYSKRIAHRGIWVEPTLLAEVEYRAKSAEGKVRHPVFKGLREDL
jgi:hypothetical protein